MDIDNKGHMLDYLRGWRCGAGLLAIEPGSEHNDHFSNGWLAGRAAYKAIREEAERTYAVKLDTYSLADGNELRILPVHGSGNPKQRRRGKDDALPARRCATCGRFCRKDGTCPLVFWDNWCGGWEHG